MTTPISVHAALLDLSDALALLQATAKVQAAGIARTQRRIASSTHLLTDTRIQLALDRHHLGLDRPASIGER